MIDYGKKYKDKNGDTWLLSKSVKVNCLGNAKESYVIFGITNQDGKSIVVIDSIIKLMELKEV